MMNRLNRSALALLTALALLGALPQLEHTPVVPARTRIPW